VHWSGRPAQPLNEPDHEGDHDPKDHKWGKKDGHEPTVSAHRGYVAGNAGLLVPANLAAKYRHIAGYLHSLVQANVAAKCGDVSGHLALVFYNNAAAECGYVSGNLATHADAAAKACELADLLVRANAYVVADLRVAGIVFRERGAGEREAKKRECTEQSRAVAATCRSHETGLRLNLTPEWD
jgi:hypothetical protein